MLIGPLAVGVWDSALSYGRGVRRIVQSGQRAAGDSGSVCLPAVAEREREDCRSDCAGDGCVPVWRRRRGNAGSDNAVHLYNTTNFENVGTLRGATSGVMSVAFSAREGEFILGTCTDNSARIWTVKTQRLRVCAVGVDVCQPRCCWLAGARRGN